MTSADAKIKSAMLKRLRNIKARLAQCVKHGEKWLSQNPKATECPFAAPADLARANVACDRALEQLKSSGRVNVRTIAALDRAATVIDRKTKRHLRRLLSRSART
jgi:hypothetical protein